MSILSKEFKGLQWIVYNDYYFEEKEDGTYIVPDLSSGILKRYNPLINDKKNPSWKRNALFATFAFKKKTKKDVYEFVKEYGLLWTDGRKKNIFGKNREPLKEIYNEIDTLNKTVRIYRALNNYKISKLRELITLKDQYFKAELGNNQDKLSSSKDAEYIKAIYTGIKKGPKLEIVLSQFPTKDSLVILFSAVYYLAEFIPYKIGENGGVLPYFSKIEIRDSDIIPRFFLLPSMESKTLAGSLWVQFYNAFILGKELIRCKREKCSEYFIKTGKREYCDNTCKYDQNKIDTRRIREEKKKRLH